MGLTAAGLCFVGQTEYVNIGREEAQNQIQTMINMVEKMETLPDNEFALKLDETLQESKSVQEKLPHHEDQLCSVCLCEGHEVKAPVKAPRCTGDH